MSVCAYVLYIHVCACCRYTYVWMHGVYMHGYMCGMCVVCICVSWVHACHVYTRGECGVYVYTHVLCVSVSHPSPSSPPPASPTGCRISAGQMLGLSSGAASAPVPAPQAQANRGSLVSRAWSGTLGGGKAGHRGQAGPGPQPDGSAGPSPPHRAVHQDKGLPHTTPTNVWWSWELRAVPQPAPPPGQEQGRGSQRRKRPCLLCTSQRSPSTAPGQREPRARFGCGGLFP